jgi:hypothetical protein
MSSPPTFFIVQKSKNAAVYQVQPLKVVLPAGTAAGSQLLVIIEGQKSGFPFGWSALNAQTTAPVVSDDKANVYAKIGSIINVSQEVANTVALSPPFSPPVLANSPPLVQPDSSGFFPSVFAFTTTATTGTRTISIGAFYDDEFHSPPVLSPPQVGGRAVYDGGIQVQVYELAGGSVTATASATGINLILLAAKTASLVFEVIVMLDSSAFSPNRVNADTVVVDSGAFLGGSSSWAVQATTSGAAVGFKNPQQYPGAVLSIG